MFYSIQGILTLREPGYVVISCNGIGFKCYTTSATQSTLPSIGSEVTLFTYLHVREDAIELYGFYAKRELDCFKLLIGVSGVGQKVALAILSSMPSERVAQAIVSGEHKSLTVAPGVGPKLAQRIILELKDKISSDSLGASQTDIGIPSAASNVSEAIQALQLLGYSSADINNVIAGLDSSLSVEELIRQFLKQMAGRL